MTKGGETIDENGKKHDSVIINKGKEICKGLWTRVQSQEISILDYVLPTNSKLLSADENKQHSVFKLEKSRKTYSDHNAILLKLRRRR